MNEELTPLPFEAREALRAEKHAFGAPSSAKARVLKRLRVGIDAQAETRPPLDAPAAPRRVWGTRAIIATFLAGGIIGASAQAWLARMGAEPKMAAPPSTALFPPASAMGEMPLAPQPEPPATVVQPMVPRAPPAASSTLGIERAMLDEARSAFARGDTAQALEAIGLHARKFPRGRLEEEREALAVKVLIAAGQPEQARTRLERFRGKFPQSFLLPGLEESVRTNP